MTAQIQRHGRAAILRALLLDRPAGATDEQLLVASKLNCTLKQINASLRAMHDSEQVRVSTTTGNRVWFLTTAMRKLLCMPDDGVAAARTDPPQAVRPAATGSNNCTTVLHKDHERLQIARDIAQFCAAGGRIEKLGVTPTRSSLTRRQINDATGDARRLRQEAKGAAA